LRILSRHSHQASGFFLKSVSAPEAWLAFANPMIEEKYSCIQVLGVITQEFTKDFSVEEYISKKLKQALEKRKRFSGYDKSCRVFYGNKDGLPGLIIDQFENAIIVQINTAGVDKYRDLIKKEISAITSKKAYFLNNEKYREKESLPTYEKDQLPDIQIDENGMRFNLRSEVMQKVGFYYDHRENRRAMKELLGRLTHPPQSGIDLFSYIGAWGISSLSAGVKRMSFVDQGDLAQELKATLELNSFSDRGEFIRSDVFKYLDECVSLGKTFDLVLCDPPAFAKSLLQKKDALAGYSKLHRKVFKIAAPKALLAFSSCTHYVDHDEFQKNILDAAQKENRNVQLLYVGLQGWDHPVSNLHEKSNYIKSYFYILE
jgi:23S rRNA (cytosine1962-C5)-methyltransferase